MSIEKKSLISNRSAGKKAIVTKPDVSKVSSTRLAQPKVVLHTPKVAVNMPKIALNTPKIALNTPKIKTY
jgi:hypothetical protein